MKFSSLKNSLFWRLSATFFVLLIFVGLAYTYIVTIASNRYYHETTQKLNANVANHLLHEIKPFENGKVNKEKLDKLMHSMMAVNPGIEVYLLDKNGKIISYVVLDKKVKLSQVSLDPVHKFINTQGKKYVLGDDPRNPGHSTVFSATQVVQEGKLQGYVYIVLASEKYQNIAQTLLSSYWLQVGTKAFLITLVFAFVIGLILIAYLTKNLRTIIRTVNEFEKGDMNARVPKKNTQGELAVLAENFNNMADSIVRNIDELKQVDNLRKELIANVSHDLRNPLAVIHGYIETMLIKSDTLSAHDRMEYLKIVLGSSEKLKRLVSELFELSKLEAGQVKVKYEPFFMNELLQDASQKAALFANKKGIQINASLENKLPRVYADISMIERVVQNLLDNAVKYTPESGWIKLQLKKEEEAIQVNIENSGDGIPESDLKEIFNRYYKVDKEESKIEGTGLGLAIVKRILDIHNAPISVNSQPAKSTTFTFNLPIYKAA